METVKEFIEKKHERNQDIDLHASPEEVIKVLKEGIKPRRDAKRMKPPKREIAKC